MAGILLDLLIAAVVVYWAAWKVIAWLWRAAFALAEEIVQAELLLGRYRRARR